MSICFHVNGIISMNDSKSDFINKFGDLCLDYDNGCLFQMNDEGVLKFTLYVRHFFMNDFDDLVNCYTKDIGIGQIHFNCNDEDGSLDSPFPNYIYVEICGGKVFTQTIETRLNYDWSYYINDSFQDIIEDRRNEVIDSINKEREKKHLEHLKNQEEYQEKVKRGEIVIDSDNELPF